MPDPLGFINPSNVTPAARFPSSGAARPQGGESFRKALADEINRVEELQQTAERAIDDYATGGRDDLEGVLIATQKADTAFRMLLQVRNKVMDAYEEVKQIRV